MMMARCFLLILASLSFLMAGCQRNSCEVWDDTKTAGRHVGRGFRSLGGKQGNSRQIRCREEFCVENARPIPARPRYCEDFIPLPEEAEYGHMQMGSYPLPFEEPGSPNSSLPGIDAFRSPSEHPELSVIFKNISFPFDSKLIKGKNNLCTIKNIAQYMKSHPRIYIFVEGHCDERGAAAYNLALGARRCNSVRDMLIEEGVDPAKVFTISYGKERPLALGRGEECWSINRRAEFKVLQR